MCYNRLFFATNAVTIAKRLIATQSDHQRVRGASFLKLVDVINFESCSYGVKASLISCSNAVFKEGGSIQIGAGLNNLGDLGRNLAQPVNNEQELQNLRMFHQEIMVSKS